MKSTQTQRFRSGHICDDPGTYRFDGYIGAPPKLEPEFARVVTLAGGDVYPTADGAACWWTPETEDLDGVDINAARDHGAM
jgi:hypothetical protein